MEGRLLGLKVAERGDNVGGGLFDDEPILFDAETRLLSVRPGFTDRRLSCRDVDTARPAGAAAKSSRGNNAFNGRVPSSKLLLRESEFSSAMAGGSGSVVFFVGWDRASVGGWKTELGGSCSCSGGATLKEGEERGWEGDFWYDGSLASNASLM